MQYSLLDSLSSNGVNTKMRNHKQLGLLLWKNYKLQRRSIIGTLLELTVPALFAIILIPIRKIVNPTRYLNDTIYSPFEIEQFSPALYPDIDPDQPSVGWCYGYSPDNSTLINRIMKQVGEKLELELRAFQNEDLMVEYLRNHTKSCLAGVSFLNESATNFTYKLRYSYSPRINPRKSIFQPKKDWKTYLLFPIFPVLGPREKSANEGGEPGYYIEGFIQVQKAIDFFLISEYNQSVLNTSIDFQRFPFPSYNDDKFVVVLAALFPFIVMLSFIFTVILLAKAIVYEKESGIKEAMKLMGMKAWIYWLSWYIKTMLILLPSLIFMIVAYKIKLELSKGGQAAIIDQTDPYLFAVFMFLYASSTITFTFMCTTLFKKANSAAAGVGIIWFLSYMPYIFISLRYEKMSMLEKIGALFVTNLGMAEGFLLIAMFEGKGVGIDFSNWTSGISVDDDFAMIQVMIVMAFTNVLHMILTWYLENIFPGDHGIAKSWWFPFQCFMSKNDQDTEDDENAATNEEIQDEFFEDETIYAQTKEVGIKIANLSKQFVQFGKQKQAVRNLSFNIYEGQITVLLGHNGAGKSTTISMMIGNCTPNGGSIQVKGFDIVKNTKKARSFLGYCPQHNLLIDDLTVGEHLELFAKLKSNTFDENETDNMLEMLDLKDKKHALSKTLSGGQKRKLSVAVAFVGSSKIVILDEPSSGMDPQARHLMWTLLQKYRKEKHCSIVLTTHFLDEADILGDRIAIMSKGRLKCCGSSLFLKSKYGRGYNLTITRIKSESAEASASNLQDDSIAKFVQAKIPSVSTVSNIGSEIIFLLPKEESRKFPSLFAELEQNKDNLKIVNIGISETTVEEVFLKIDDNLDKESTDNFDDDDDEDDDAPEDAQSVATEDNDPNNAGLWIGLRKEDHVAGFRLAWQQFKALIVKRFINSTRNKILVLSQLVIPILILLINIIYLKYSPIKPVDSPPLEISMSRYFTNYIPIAIQNETIEFDADDEEDHLGSTTISPGSLQLKNSSQNSDFMMKLINFYEHQLNDTNFNVIDFELNKTDTVRLCDKSRSNIEEFVTCLGQLSLNYITDIYLLGTTFMENTNKIRLHFNNQPYHMPALTMNLLSNTLFRLYSNVSENTIHVINHPLPRNTTEQIIDMQLLDKAGFTISTGLTFSFSFLIASFVIFLIKERVSSSKHLQYMGGCNKYLFWISALLFDIVNYLVPMVFVIILLEAFDYEEFTGKERVGYVIGLLILYGFAHIPQMYLCNYLFNVSATGFAALTSWNILTSQASLTTVQILSLPQLGLVSMSRTLDWVFTVIFPNFAMGQGLIDLYNNYQILKICKPIEPYCAFYKNPCCTHFNSTEPDKCGVDTDCMLFNENFMAWEKPGLMRFFVLLPIQFVVHFGLLLLYETGYLLKVYYFVASCCRSESRFERIQNAQIAEEEQLYNDVIKDSDVVDEERRIESIVDNLQQSNNTSDSLNRDIFVLNNLKKFYSRFMAVKGISLGIKPNECFGLLGLNGAGKSSTFKMITGDEYITHGDAYLNATSIKSHINAFQQQLGYCPQINPLIDYMTVRETLVMFARLRGIRPGLIKAACRSLIDLMDLREHRHKMCFTLSGGTKRKLSVAIALMGSPCIVLLDEPTSGMDPKARRNLWNSLNKIRKNGKSLILTTHSMDETEALCTRVGIMVNGELKCLGTLQHLKSRYGKGFTLMAKMVLKLDLEHDKTIIANYIEYISATFPNAVLTENRDGYLSFHLKDGENDNSSPQRSSTNQITLSTIFTTIEATKDQYSVEYYIVTQTKLESIFLSFADKQIDPESRNYPSSACCKCKFC